MDFQNPYVGAPFIDELKESRLIILTDLDGTMSVRHDEVDSPQELVDRKAARESMKRKRAIQGAATFRGLSSTISKKDYLASRDLMRVEAPIRWVKTDTGKYRYQDPATIPFFDDCLGWDIVASVGGGIIVRNGDGYLLDKEFDKLLKYDYAKGGKLNPEPWRDAMFALLIEKHPEVAADLVPLESRMNYRNRVTNYPPRPYCIELSYKGIEGFKRMERLGYALDEELVAGNPLAIRAARIEESKHRDENPDQSEYKRFLVPWAGRKEKMANWILSSCAKAADIPPQSIKLRTADDTFTGFRLGLYGGGGDMAFLLAKNSRLAPYLINRRPSYGGEDLSFLWEGDDRGSRLVPHPTKRGVYTFVHKIRKGWDNTIVIADERYHDVKTAPGSVDAFVQEFC